MGFPQKLSPDEIPKSVEALVAVLLPQLLAGEHPALIALQAQAPRATIVEVTMTGVGFYVDFETPSDAPLAMPTDFAGGDAAIRLRGAEHSAGCVVFVRGGRLAQFEGYTHGDDSWPIDAEVVEVSNVFPVVPY